MNPALLSNPVSIEAMNWLDVFAKSLARQFLWKEENATTHKLRRPLRDVIAESAGAERGIGIPLVDFPEGSDNTQWNFSGIPLLTRAHRLMLRGLILHYWTEIYHGSGKEFRTDRYAHLSSELASFGQELNS